MLKISDTKRYRSPLTQGGLEIRSVVTALWENEEFLSFLKISIEKRYNVLNNERDDSSDILKQVNIPEKDSESEYEEEEMDDNQIPH